MVKVYEVFEVGGKPELEELDSCDTIGDGLKYAQEEFCEDLRDEENYITVGGHCFLEFPNGSKVLITTNPEKAHDLMVGIFGIGIED